jgi:transposase-like protein
MEMLGKIRRLYFRDKLSLHQIAKRTGLSRNTIRKWVRAPEATQPAYQRCAAFNKLSPFHDTLEQALKADSFRAKHNRRSAKALFEQIKAEGMTAATASSRRLYARGEVNKASLYALSYR